MGVATYCTTCGRGSWACTCDLSYRERLLSIQLHPDATPSRTKRNYYDAEAVHQTFGDDATDRYYDETSGFGAVIDGTVRDPKTHERRAVTPDDIGLDF